MEFKALNWLACVHIVSIQINSEVHNLNPIFLWQGKVERDISASINIHIYIFT